LGDDLVQGRVAETGAPGRRRVVAGIAVPEHPRSAGTKDGQCLGELVRPVTVRSPRGGDDPRACTRGGMLGEDTSREETFVVRVSEDAEQ
jgi:hypothetical protein